MAGGQPLIVFQGGIGFKKERKRRKAVITRLLMTS